MFTKREELNELLDAFWHKRVDRRQFMTRAALLGVSASAITALAGSRRAFAQGEGTATTSITRQDYGAALQEHFQFAEPTAQGGTMILADLTDISTTNPLLMGDSPTNDLFLGHVFETLIGVSVIDGTPVPGLVDYWEVAADGVTHTLYIAPEAAFSDGSPVTADDAIYSIERRIDPETGGQYQSSVAPIVSSFTKVDDKTLTVVSNGVQATFLINFFNYCPIIKKSLWENVPAADWPTDPGSTGQPAEQAVQRIIGSGPFKFVEWVQGDHVTFARNETHWNTVSNRIPALDEVIFRVLPDDAALAQAVRTGEIDLYDTVVPGEVESLHNEDAVDVLVYDSFSFGWYGYNLDPEKTTLFQDVRTRQALFYGLDRQAIVDNIQLGFGEVAHGTQPVLSIAYAPDQMRTRYDYDPEKARQLLAEAGWTPGDDGVLQMNGQKLQFEVLTTEGAATNEQTISYMQEAWRELGVDAQPRFTQFPVLLDALNETHDYDIILLGFNWDVTGEQEAMFGCDFYDGGFNTMKYCNPEWDRLNQEQKVELDPERRREILIEQSNIVNDDLPVGIINFRKNRTAYNVRLKNYNANGIGGYQWSWPYVYVEDEG